MKFLDLNGLTHFWSKIKDWSNSNFFSNEGGEISPKKGLHYIINGEQLDVSKTDNENETISIFNVDKNGISAKRIVMTEGNATQVLVADGSLKTLGSSNGIATLDSNGNIPLAQLGNLDTTVAEVVTALPTTNIKKHIYLVKDTSGVTQNQYEEYIYTGNTSATYDASKWEKLGDFRATVDLAGYAKTADVNTALSNKVDKVNGKGLSTNDFTAEYKSKLDSIAPNANNYSLPLAANSTRGGIQVGYAANGKNYPVQLAGEKAYVNVPWIDTTYDLTPYAKKNDAVGSMEILQTATAIQFVLKSIDDTEVDWPSISAATSTLAGVMKPSDKAKLDGIANNANNYSLPTASSTTKGGITLGYSQSGKNYPVVLDSNGKAYVNVPWTDTNITYGLATPSTNGLMSAEDKTKLNDISSGATADSAITTAEIDTLFT